MPEKEFKPTKGLEARKKHLVLLANKCAKFLREKYKVKRVFLIGSLAKGYIHDRSDIDLVVEGLPPELYVKALTESYELLPRGLELKSYSL